MGVTVRQKVKGKGQPWWVFISHNGQRTSRKVGDKKAAEAVASEIRARIQLGNFGFEEKKPVPVFKDLADSWINITVPATCKYSSLQDYRDILRLHVMPVFGDMPITEITRGKVKDFLLEKINQGYAKSTVNHMKNAISGVLNKAVDNEALQVNPAQRLGKFGKANNGDPERVIDPLSAEELRLLLDTVQEHYPEHYTMFLLLARTGVRIGEAVGLKWGDIDYNGRYINVSRSYVLNRVSTPKSGKARPVDMTYQLADALKAHNLESKKKGLKLGLGEIPEYVFTNETGVDFLIK